MSRAAKFTLAGTSLGAIGIVYLVHYQQQAEKTVRLPKSTFVYTLLTIYVQAMHAGVIRDMEQQRIKKERQADFEMQRALEEEYRKVQSVHDGAGGGQKVGGGP